MAIYSLAEAQSRKGALYREHARRAPWNSKCRVEWLRLAAAADRSHDAALREAQAARSKFLVEIRR